MFIDPSTISRLAPFEGAEDNQLFYHSRNHSAPSNGARGGCCIAAYRHLTPNRGETRLRDLARLCGSFQILLKTETFDPCYSNSRRGYADQKRTQHAMIQRAPL